MREILRSNDAVLISFAEADVTDDAFLGGALRILQPKEGYRAGIDAVFLAAAAPARTSRKERVLDVGAGVGA
ncbi:MAG TPA: hypothetical protein VFE11_15445, partial [Dongiaceae bacterium]|nr:hypothetical protein [Dongiaceae bacterium]